jgi:S1-C subfamily serine protease
MLRPAFLFSLIVAMAPLAARAQSPAERPTTPGAQGGNTLPAPPGPKPPAPGAPPPGAPPSPSPSEPLPPSGAQPAPAQTTAAPPVAVKTDDKLSVLRVNVTNQPWDFLRPWGKRSPYSRRAVGAVLPDHRVLVTAELVANANYLEFETPDGSQKSPASIVTVDYEANLAVLKADDEKFLDAFKPVEFTTAAVGDTLSVWQLENTGTVLATKGSMTTAEVSRYPVDDSPLLVYRATVSLQFRDSSFTLPVAKDDKLVGLVMRYDNNTKSIEVVPTPIIQHFLKDLAEPPYGGFPRTGIAFSNTRDPQFRRYLGLDAKKNAGGVYVSDVLPATPAEQAGLKKGDIIMQIDGQAIDQDGNYQDKEYGKLSLTHLVGTHHFDGDVLTFVVFRNGENIDVPVKIAHRGLDQYVIEPYVIDRPPHFFVLGGLVLQELSRQYLKEWGADWLKKAPEELVFFDRYQNELFKDGPKKLVMLSSVLPSPATVGYEELHHLIVTRINGTTLQSLADVPAALEKCANGLHKIEFADDPTAIYLDAAAITTGAEGLMKNYRIPVLERLD